MKTVMTLLCCLFATTLLQAAVSIEPIDTHAQFDNMTDRSLALDSDGNPYIVYGEDWLYHSWYNGTQWSHETVDRSLEKDERASFHSAGQ